MSGFYNKILDDTKNCDLPKNDWFDLSTTLCNKCEWLLTPVIMGGLIKTELCNEQNVRVWNCSRYEIFMHLFPKSISQYMPNSNALNNLTDLGCDC